MQCRGTVLCRVAQQASNPRVLCYAPSVHGPGLLSTSMHADMDKARYLYFIEISLICCLIYRLYTVALAQHPASHGLENAIGNLLICRYREPSVLRPRGAAGYDNGIIYRGGRSVSECRLT